MRYGITSSNTSSLSCQCGTSFSVDHQSYYSSVLLLCPFGGFHTIIHNEVRDLTTSLLTEVCHNVAIEPSFTEYNQLLQRPFLLHQATPLMMLVWILRPELSEVGARMHILMLGYFTLNLTSAYKHTMMVQRSESIVIKLRTLIMESSLHWYFL